MALNFKNPFERGGALFHPEVVADRVTKARLVPEWMESSEPENVNTSPTYQGGICNFRTTATASGQPLLRHASIIADLIINVYLVINKHESFEKNQVIHLLNNALGMPFNGVYKIIPNDESGKLGYGGHNEQDDRSYMSGANMGNTFTINDVAALANEHGDVNDYGILNRHFATKATAKTVYVIHATEAGTRYGSLNVKNIEIGGSICQDYFFCPAYTAAMFDQENKSVQDILRKAKQDDCK